MQKKKKSTRYTQKKSLQDINLAMLTCYNYRKQEATKVTEQKQ